MNKLHKNCPIKVHRLFITLTRSLTNSIAQKTVKFLKNSEKDVFSLWFFKVNKQYDLSRRFYYDAESSPSNYYFTNSFLVLR